MGSSRRRAIALLAGALLLALAAWLAASIVPTVGLRTTGAGDDAGLEVSAELPAATCHKTFSRDFPWVRIWCDPREEEGAPSGADAGSRGSPRLDSPGGAE
jgi:hypothetical protein